MSQINIPVVPAVSLTANLPQLPTLPNVRGIVPQLPNVPPFPSIPALPTVPSLSSLTNGIPGFPNGSDGSDPLANVDVVGIYDDSFNQLFDLARPMKANLSPTSKLMSHPMEVGAVQSDFRIIGPMEIELTLICTGNEPASVYQQLRALFLAGDFVTIQTKSGMWFNMMLQAMPSDEIPDQFDVLTVSAKFKEVILIQTQYQALTAAAVANPSDQSTVKVGQQTPKASSAAYALFFNN